MDNPAHQSRSTSFAVPVQRRRRVPNPPPVAPKVSVLLVDDTPDILGLLRMTFDFRNGVEVCAEASDGRQAIEQWRRHRPDVGVMDLRMPVLTGLEAAAQILAEDAEQRIVLFSASFRPADAAVAEAIGVAGCFDKCSVDRLLEFVVALGLRTRVT